MYAGACNKIKVWKMRKKLIAGNWKMNKSLSEAMSYADKLRHLLEDWKNRLNNYSKDYPSNNHPKNNLGNYPDIALFVPFTLLSCMKEYLKGTGIMLGAQNMFYEDSGPYTGEVSPIMVRDFAEFVLIGHSERRRYFNETDKIINKKIKSALKNRLKIIFCIGETIEEKKRGLTKDVLRRQIIIGLDSVKEINGLVIAYEPVWAIGSGKSASPDEANNAHKFIRNIVESLYSSAAVKSLRIIYGGSVSPENAGSFLDMPEIDGCLPGGASLDPEKFFNIIKQANK